MQWTALFNVSRLSVNIQDTTEVGITNTFETTDGNSSYYVWCFLILSFWFFKIDVCVITLQNYGYPNDHWYGTYEFLNHDVKTFKGQLKFYIVKATVWDPVTRKSKVVFKKILIHWLSSCRRYYLQPRVDNSKPDSDPENWATGLFLEAVYPNTSFYEYELDQLLNPDDTST